MAQYVTTVRTAMSAAEAFAYMADFRNVAAWDPGVSSAVQVEGDGPEVGARYEVKASGAELTYVVLEYDAPERIVLEAKNTLIRSYDIIAVEERSDGCDVTYDATLELNGPLAIGDFAFGLIFNKIGDKASAGMIERLDGTKIR